VTFVSFVVFAETLKFSQVLDKLKKVVYNGT